MTRNLNDPLNKHKNLHFDDGLDIHMSSKNNEENGYMYDLELLIVSQ